MNDTRFKPGALWTGNKNGRPKGSKSLKTYVKEMLKDMNDEEKLEFIQQVDPKTIWEMAEGKAEQKSDITSGGEKILPVLVQFLDGKPTDYTNT